MIKIEKISFSVIKSLWIILIVIFISSNKTKLAIFLSLIGWLLFFMKYESKIWYLFGERVFRDRMVNLFIMLLYSSISAWCLIVKLNIYFIPIPIFLFYVQNFFLFYNYCKNNEDNSLEKYALLINDIMLFGVLFTVCFTIIFQNY